MPKDTIERAIKKASAKAENYDEVTFEGYGRDGIAVLSNVPQTITLERSPTLEAIFESLMEALVKMAVSSLSLIEKVFF